MANVTKHEINVKDTILNPQDEENQRQAMTTRNKDMETVEGTSKPYLLKDKLLQSWWWWEILQQLRKTILHLDAKV